MPGYDASSWQELAHPRTRPALDEVMKDRTTFVVAHRLATVRRATRILVFEAGRIVETGTTDQLIRLGLRASRTRTISSTISPAVPVLTGSKVTIGLKPEVESTAIW